MSATIRVLIVEDSEDDALLILRELRRCGYEPDFQRVCTPVDLKLALEAKSWELILSDFAMPQFDGLAALQILKASGQDIPFILVSGTVGEETAVASMKAGASDYLIKGHLARLGPAIQRELREADQRRLRRLAEQSLSESEMRFRSLCASSPVGIFQTDTSGICLYTNERFNSIIGLVEREHPRKPWFSCAHPGDHEKLSTDWTSATDHLAAFSQEFRLLSSQGDTRWVHARASAIRAESGDVTGYVGTLEEITESKQAQERIRRQFERLTALRAIDVAILSSLDLHYTLDVIQDQVIALLGAHATDCLLFNPSTQLLEFAGGRGLPQSGITPRPLRRGEGYAGRSVLEQRPVYVADVNAIAVAPTSAELLASERFVAYCAIPLIANGEPQGVLELYHREPLPLDAESLEFLQTLAGQAAIAIFTANLIDTIRSSHAELAVAYDATLEGWVRALDLRDHETEGHTRRVTEMTVRLARAMDLPESSLIHIRRGALLHDIGKIGIQDHVLLKPGPLDDAEWVQMKKHPIYAYEWLQPVEYLRPCLDIPYCHHEKWDGTGYPRGLAGEAIPLTARIFAVVDVWDALSSDRPYRKGWAADQVQSHIVSLSGTQFDPAVVDAFLRLLSQVISSAPTSYLSAS